VAIEIAVPHRVAIHRRIVERRQIERCCDVGGEHPAARGAEADSLGLGHRLHALRDQPLHVGDRHQRPGEREAIVGELRHQALRIAAATLCNGAACCNSTSAMVDTSSRPTTGTLACGNAMSEAIATICGSSGAMSGLPFAARWISSFGKASRLKPSTKIK